MSKGSQTTTQQTSTSPPSYIADAYKQYIQQIQGVNQQPYVPYTGEGVAPVNAQQTTGIGGINTYANAAQPAYAQGLGLISGAANPLSAAQIQQYYDPYQQQVIAATEAQLNQQNAIQQQQVLGNAAAQGALGGNRVGLTQAALAGQQQLQEAPIIAGLEQQGYNQALATAAQQFQQNPMAAAYGLGNLGAGAQAAGLQGAGAQISAGTLQQQTQQAQDTYAYTQYLQAQGFPYQEAQWYASQLAGVGSLAGGTSQGTTTGPPPSLFGQLLGLGTAGAGAYGAYQSAQQPTTHEHGGRIKGYQTGGSPYGVAGGYVPAANMGHGPGPPQVRAPAAPGQQGGASSMFSEAQNLASMGKLGQGVGSGLSGLGGGTPSAAAWGGSGADLGTIGPGLGDLGAGMGAAGTAGAGIDFAGGVAGLGTAIDAIGAGLGAGDAAAMLPLALLAVKKGGRIKMPMRAGMGMPSFVRGYQGGGSPNFDQEFADTMRQEQLTAQAYGINPSAFSNPNVPVTVSPEGGFGQLAELQAPEPGTTTATGAPLAFTGDTGGGGGLQPSSYQPPLPPRMAPSARPQVVPGQGGQGFLGMSPEFWQSLMASGLGMMASARPGVPAGVAIGQGGIEGFKTYGGLKGKEADIEMESRKLDQQAQAESDRIAMEGRRLTEMTPYQRQELSLRQQQLQQEVWKPFTDVSGMTRFFNSKTGEIKDTPPIKAPGVESPVTAPSGTPAAPGTPTSDAGTSGEVEKQKQVAALDPQIAAQAGNGISADSYDAKPASIKTPTHPELQNRNEEFLKTLDPYTQNLLKGVADYKINPAQLSYRDKTMVARFIATYDPGWSQVQYNNIAKALPNFTGSGVEARNMISQDMAMQHIGSAFDNIRKLDQGNVVSWNRLRNAIKGQYDPETQAVLGGLGTDVQAIQNELTTSFRGSGHPSEREALQWAQKIDYNNPAGLRGALQEAASLLGGRIAAAGHRYNDAVGDTYARDPLSWMSTKGTAAYNRALNIDPVKGEGPAKPSLKDFLDKARTANPSASEQELTDYYKKKYGG